jgi:ribonuclease R
LEKLPLVTFEYTAEDMLNHERVLRLVRDELDHPATPREMLQRLKIPRDQRSTFTRILTDLVADGALVQTRGNRYGIPDRMNLVVGRMITHPRGFGFVVPDRPLEEVSGDVYIAGSNLNQAMHGDRVVARLERVTRTEPSKGASSASSSADRTAPSSAASISTRSGLGFVVPFDRRLIMDVQVPVRRGPRRRARRHGRRRDHALADPARGPLGRVIEVLGDIDAPGVDTRSSSASTASPTSTATRRSPRRRRLGAKVRERDLEGRTDFRASPSPSTASTRATSTMRSRSSGCRTATTGSGCTSPTSRTTSRRGASLDEEAYERGTSVYFPERAVHMFPSELATGSAASTPRWTGWCSRA